MEDYPKYVQYNGIRYKRAWLFDTRSGRAATYVSREQRKSINIGLEGDTLYILESAEEVSPYVPPRRCGNCACRNSSGFCGMKPGYRWVDIDDGCTVLDSSGAPAWTPTDPAA